MVSKTSPSVQQTGIFFSGEYSFDRAGTALSPTGRDHIESRGDNADKIPAFGFQWPQRCAPAPPPLPPATQSLGQTHRCIHTKPLPA